jgi:hypothetical protein
MLNTAIARKHVHQVQTFLELLTSSASSSKGSFFANRRLLSRESLQNVTQTTRF